jgi:hypothetical protein
MLSNISHGETMEAVLEYKDTQKCWLSLIITYYYFLHIWHLYILFHLCCGIELHTICDIIPTYNLLYIFLPWLSTELLHIRRNLPDGVDTAIVNEGMTYYGMFIACNDHVALAHADLCPVLS